MTAIRRCPRTAAREAGIPTAFGTILLVWTRTPSGPKVCRIVLPGDRRPQFATIRVRQPDSCGDPAIEALAASIGSFLSGNDVRFDTGILDMNGCSPFQQSVLLAEYGIPRGYVSTYGLIARHLGRPGGARAVGNALARNPFPVIIPCHRAVRADGSLGGFQGGVEMKRRLLEMEEVGFLADGRAAMDRVWYRPAARVCTDYSQGRADPDRCEDLLCRYGDR